MKPTPQSLGCNCQACPYKANSNKPVWGEIPTSPQAVLVGEAPGQDEADAGRPFMGATGRELDVSIANAGLARKNLAVLNAVLCRPPPSAEEDDIFTAVKCCKPALTYQITENKLQTLPRFLMGKAAFNAFYGRKTIENARGFIRDGNTIVSYHPTYAFFYNAHGHAIFDVDLLRFARLIGGRMERGPTRILTNPSVDDFQRLVTDSGGVLACDIETTSATPERHYEGKAPTQAVLKTIGFGCETWGLSIWWETISPELQAAIAKVFKDQAIVKVFHNGFWFDIPVLERHGFKINNAEDTRDMRRALSATSPLNLNYVCSIYNDYFPWKETEAGADGGKTK